MIRRRHAAARVVAAALLLLAPSATLAAARPTASFTQMEQQFMCVDCHEALNVAQSQESFSERQYLRDLIRQGLTPSQIKTQMVAAYGPAVLSAPPASGFNLTIYILPPAIVVLGAIGLAVALPRWHRRTRAAGVAGLGGVPTAPALDPDDARRLDEDLARHV